MLAVIIITLAVIYVVGHIVFHYVSQKCYGLPPGPIPLPIIGNIHLLGTSPHSALKDLSKKYGDVYRIYFGSEMAIVVTCIDAAVEGLIQKSTDFAGRPSTYTLDITSGNGKGIAFVDYGPMWKLVRKIGHQSLRMYGDGMRHLEELIIRESEELHKRLDKCAGNSINPHNNMALAIMNVICAMIFGSRYDIDDEEFRKIIHANVTFIRAFEYDMLVDIFPILRILPNKKIKMIKEALNLRDPVLERKLKEHRDRFDGENINDMTDALLKAAKDAINDDSDVKQYLTDEHLLKIMDDMFGAGSETTTTTVRWGLLYLTQWPEVQDKAYKYIMQVVGPDRLPVYDDRQSLSYLEAVVHEILRMGCIAPFAVPHKTTKDTTLFGYDIPKNTQVFFNIWALHYDEREWDDPYTFKPERFLDQNGNVVPGENRSYLPFSAGRRVCLAEPLAKMELFLLFSRLLHDYKFLPDPSNPLPDLEGIYGLFLAPQNYRVVIQKRSNEHIEYIDKN